MDRELKKILHDSLFKDPIWQHGDTLDRVQWLLDRIEKLEREKDYAWEMCDSWHTAYDTVRSISICEE